MPETRPAAKQPDLSGSSHQRTMQRFPCDLVLSCRLVRKRHACAQVSVVDLSTTGIRLILDRGLEPQTILAIDVQKGQIWARTLLARVAHSTERADGTWAIGCQFANPLSEEEVRELLA